MSITARLYAGVKERAGQATVRAQAASIGELREALARACPAIAEQLATCRFAVDDEFVDDSTALASQATVDVIPPVSGG